jgi:hypothetical protein
MKILLTSVFGAMLLFSSISLPAQATAQSHVQLSTRVLKQIQNPVNETEFVYLSPQGISRTEDLQVDDALDASIIGLPNDHFPQDVAYSEDGRLFALLSVNSFVDVVLLDSLILVEITDQGIVELAELSSNRSVTGRLAVRAGEILAFEGRPDFAMSNSSSLAILHTYEIASGNLSDEVLLGGSTDPVLFISSDDRFHSLQADYEAVYQLIDTALMIRIEPSTGNSELLTQTDLKLSPFSYETIRDTTWVFGLGSTQDQIDIYSPSAELTLQAPATGDFADDVLASPSGGYILRIEADPGFLHFGDMRGTTLERVPFYEANMLELAGFNELSTGEEHLTYSLGVGERDRYQTFINGQCPSLIRATFFAEYNDRDELFVPNPEPIIGDFEVSELTKTFAMIALGDSLFDYTLEGVLRLANYGNESVGIRTARTVASNPTDRGCNNPTTINQNFDPFSSSFTTNREPALTAWRMSIGGYPATPFGEPQIFDLPITSSTSEVYQPIQSTFPNPTTGLVTIEFDAQQSSLIEWTLVSIDGRKHAIAPIMVSGSAATFSLGGFPFGIYQLIGLNEEGGIRTTVSLVK